MLRYNLIISTLGLIGLSTTTLTAQTADTLRRQLQVFTSEDTKLSEQQALPLDFVLPKVQLPKLRPFAPSELKGDEQLRVSPLRLLASPSELLRGSQDLGFVSLSAGIKYNAYLAAGIRPLHAKEQVLDVYVDTRYTNYRISDMPVVTNGDRYTKEHAFLIGANYTATLANKHSLDIKASFGSERNNYNAQPNNYLRNNQFSLSGSIDNTIDQEALWQYRVSPRVIFMSARGLYNESYELSPRETRLGVDLSLAYRLNNTMQVGADVGADTYLYGGERIDFFPASALPSRNAFTPLSAFSLRPFWQVGSDQKLNARLGIRLDLYSKEESWLVGTSNSRSYFKVAPDLSVNWHFAPSWLLSAKATSTLRANGIADMLSEMPYAGLSGELLPTYTPIDGELSISGLINSKLSVRAFLGYALYENPLNYYASLPGINQGVIYYRAENVAVEGTDGDVVSYGASLKYRPLQRLTVSAGVKANKWHNALLGRSNLDLDVSLTYKPTERLELSAGYLLRYGIDQLTERYSGGLRSTDQIPLSSYYLVQAGGSYEVISRLSIQLFGHIVPSEDATLYYGYTPQRISANLGISYRF